MATPIATLLGAIWGNRKGYVFLPHKDSTDANYPRKGWHETNGLPYTGTVPDLQELPPLADVYFCPVVFSAAQRKKEYALPTNVLWADLDPIHPNQCKLRPSIAWESSPGRYQALWLLDQDIDPNEAAELSKRIAYTDGGDKGGWDLTQVLRLPGTTNFKYPTRPPVRLLWAKRKSYSVSRVRSIYPPVNGSSSGLILDQGTPTSLFTSHTEMEIQSAVSRLSIGLKNRLSSSTEGADRSLELQKLSRDLLKSGITPSLALHIIQRSSWNKFAGRSDELEQLQKQIMSAIDAVAQQSERHTAATSGASRREAEQSADFSMMTEMKVHQWNDFLSIPTQLRWLVQDSWVDQTVGFISGRSKSFKTWIALDLALSVLSKEPFLNQFPVARTGPVLLIQEEDPTAILQERLRLISKRKGMLPKVKAAAGSTRLEMYFPEYPLHIINLQGFSLTIPEKIAQVRRILGQVNPILVILDPLIVMLGQTDENKATAIAAILQEVKMWREDFKCNVVIVHHWNKSRTEDGDRGGSHMYGSFAFHAWLESALHVEPIIDPETTKIDTVIVEREFKAAPGNRQLKLKFDIETSTDYRYDVSNLGATLGALAEKILDLLRANMGWMTTGELVTLSGYSRSKVIEELGKLTRMARVEVQKGGGRGKESTYRIKEQASSD